MKKSWLTAVSVVGALGTGSAVVMAGAVMNSGSNPQSSAPVPDLTAPHTAVYQVGSAARISLSSAGGTITVISVTPNAGWSLVSTSPAASSVTVTLTDSTQIVTFIASSVAGEIQTSVTATLAAGLAASPDATAPSIVIQQPGDLGSEPNSAVPPTFAPNQSRTVGAVSTTSQSSSTSHAGSGTWKNDNHESNDEGNEANDD
ncbi:MAG: hypothetical protein WCK14_11880 [Actinomycetota bacterium]